jgi:DNA-binding NtrC family response regulator
LKFLRAAAILIFVTKTSDDLDSIYLKAAGTVIQHVLVKHNGNFRRAANALGANHSTLSRILKKFNQSYNQKPFHSHRRMKRNGRAAIAAAA